MSDPVVPFADDAESLFDGAPCGYLTIGPEGRIERVNATFARMTGRAREQVVGTRFTDLLPRGARIFHETHTLPLLHMQGAVQELAVDVLREDGTRLPMLLNATLERGDAGAPRVIRAALFDATQRRAYEQQLVRMRDDERDVARVLQESLLAVEPPRDPRLGLASFYAPSVDGLTIGGDWHDSFATAPDRISLVVGDIVGTGLMAASSMGRVRSAVRAYATAGIGAGPLLGLLDGFVAIDPPARYTTLVYLDVDLSSGIATMAAAGHPPALLLAPGAAPELLWGGRSAPLGSYRVPYERPDARVELAPGARLFLYTDGLVERRTEPLDVGFARLLAAAEATRDLPLAAQLDELVVTMVRDLATKDDVCLLAAERPRATTA